MQSHFQLVTAVCILMQNIGAMSSYMFIIKNQLPSVLHTIICAAADTPEECPNLYGEDVPWYLNGNMMVIIVVVCVVAPLASLKSIEFLGEQAGHWLLLTNLRIHKRLFHLLHGLFHDHYRQQVFHRCRRLSAL